jgi:hypothetical protein
VSARRTKLRAGLGGLLLALYPEAWRERYGAEVSALMEDDPPGTRGLRSLLLGAADAHVRPQRSWRERVPPSTSMRVSVGALFACWMLVALAGSAFAKETEGLSPVEHEHGLLIAARDMITIGAFAGAAAIALGGLPLVWQALGAAVRRRDRRLAGLLAAPALAAGLLLALAALLLLVGPSRHGRFPPSFVLGVLVPLTLAVLGCAAVGALAPKAVMRRAQARAAAAPRRLGGSGADRRDPARHGRPAALRAGAVERPAGGRGAFGAVRREHEADAVLRPGGRCPGQRAGADRLGPRAQGTADALKP